LAIPLLCVFANAQAATNASSITLPIEISLDSLRQKLGADPDLTSVNLDRPEQACIKESWISISCVLTGHAKRVGDIRLSGHSNQIELAFPVQTKLTAKTTSGIRSSATVEGELDLRVRAAVELQSDWHAKLDLSVDYHWNKPPTLELLRAIKIPLRNYVDPRLDKKIAELQAKSPALAAELDVRSRAQRAWQDLQRTQVIKGKSPLYFRFNPSAAYFSGIEISGDTLSAALTLQGAPELSTFKLATYNNIPLPQLQQTSAAKHSGFALNTSIQLDFKALNTEAGKAERQYQMKDNSLIDVEKLLLRESEGRLVLNVAARVDKRPKWLKRIDVFDWFEQSGVFDILLLPQFDEQLDRLVLSETQVRMLKGDIKTSLFADQIVERLQEQLNQNMHYHFGASLDKLKSRFNQQLAALGSVGQYQLSGELEHIKLQALSVTKSGLQFELRLNGDLALSL